MGCGLSPIKKKSELTHTSQKNNEIVRRFKNYTVSDLRNMKVKGLYTVNEVGSSQELSMSLSKEFKSRTFCPSNHMKTKNLTTRPTDQLSNKQHAE